MTKLARPVTYGETIGAFTVTTVETFPAVKDDNGESIGQQIDKMLAHGATKIMYRVKGA